jgi:hypothetical protein
MADFLTTNGTVHYVEQIISGAKERIVLISPYLQISPIFRQRLADAAGRGVPITVVMRQIHDELREWLLSVPGLALYELPILHAKCYFNERLLVLTSFNFYEHSQRNREMGVAVAVGDPMYADARTEAESILREASRVSTPGKSAKPGTVNLAPPPKSTPTLKPTSTPKPMVAPKARGFCIRCAGQVTLNPTAPLCRECWTVWVVFENEEYPEKFCHECGRRADTSKVRPRCERCFRKSATALR